MATRNRRTKKTRTLNTAVRASISFPPDLYETLEGALCMPPPGLFLPSTVLKDDPRARETHHQRAHETSLFCIHYLFMAAATP